MNWKIIAKSPYNYQCYKLSEGDPASGVDRGGRRGPRPCGSNNVSKHIYIESGQKIYYAIVWPLEANSTPLLGHSGGLDPARPSQQRYIAKPEKTAPKLDKYI